MHATPCIRLKYILSVFCSSFVWFGCVLNALYGVEVFPLGLNRSQCRLPKPFTIINSKIFPPQHFTAFRCKISR